ncbi:MAG: molybdate ABC transporter substrate-binding protein [Desulfuromonadales bacterium C00003096]|nr:MAG: molybdate ABC transporter substrate-binding protein [Desulfuromonadales bacterium C00003096]
MTKDSGRQTKKRVAVGRRRFALLSLLLIFCTLSCTKENRVEKEADPLFVLSGAGLKCVLDPLAEEFTKETGIEVEYSYLCSAMLLTNLELTHQGDVFVAGAKYYFNLARDKGLVDEEHMVIAGYQVPCIMVQEGNPKNIQSLDDLLKPGMRLGVGDFEAMAVGRLAKEMLKRAGILDQFMKNVVVVGGSAPKLCLPVCMNSIDAAINLTATAKTFDHCSDIVLIDKERVMYSTFPVALTIYARKIEEAMKYYNFMQCPKARKILEKYGYGIYFDPKAEQYLE